MVSIFSCSDYKKFVFEVLEAMPRRGRGQLAKMAIHLGLHAARISQIFNGDLHLTADQAQKVATFLGLGTIETEFFITLVLRDRAESKELRAIFEGQLERMREKAKQIVNRVPRDLVLSGEQKAEFYSSWFYSAIRLATSIDSIDSPLAVAEFLGLDRARVAAVLEFLLRSGLCIEVDGRIRMGPKTTHLEQTSPLVLRHHSNWRVRALNRHESLRPEELAYTCPVSIRAEDMPEIRELLTQTIEKFLKRVTASDPADTLACLNVDWFRVKG